MTQKQLRDIAAYYGARYRFEIYERNTEKPEWPYEWQVKEGDGISLFTALALLSIGVTEPNVARNFKLYLRPISSLTDSEVDYVNQLCERKLDDLMRKAQAVQYQLFDKTRTVESGTTIARVIAYLQSLGVYVPGMVDEELVEITA